MQDEEHKDKKQTSLYQIEDWISMFILFVLVAVVIFQIASRYFFDSPLFWTEEISRNLLIVLTFIGAPIAVRNNSNISLDFIIGFLPVKIRRFFAGIAQILELSFYMVGAYLSIQMAIFSRSRLLVSIQISKGLIFGLIAFGFVLMTFRCLMRFLAFISNKMPLREGK